MFEISINVVLILFIVILYILNRDSDVERVIRRIKEDIEEILNRSGYKLVLVIIESHEKTYTDKEKIFLVVKREGKLYSYDTLIKVCIHEVSHILCPELGHTEKFFRIENGLIETAKYLGIVGDKEVHEEYPCEAQ